MQTQHTLVTHKHTALTEGIKKLGGMLRNTLPSALKHCNVWMTKTKNIQNIFTARAPLAEQQVCSPCISSKENQVEFQFYPLVLRVYDEQKEVPVREV